MTRTLQVLHGRPAGHGRIRPTTADGRARGKRPQATVNGSLYFKQVWFVFAQQILVSTQSIMIAA